MNKQLVVMSDTQLPSIGNGGLFFCIAKMSERLAATIDNEEKNLAYWVCREFQDRVLADGALWEQAVKAIGEKVAELNRSRIGLGRYFDFAAKLPTNSCLGYLRINRANARKQCIHVSVRQCNGYAIPDGESLFGVEPAEGKEVGYEGVENRH